MHDTSFQAEWHDIDFQVFTFPCWAPLKWTFWDHLNILTSFFRGIFNSTDKKTISLGFQVGQRLPYLKPSRQALNDRFYKAGQNILTSILSCLGEIFYLMNSPRETSNIYHSTPWDPEIVGFQLSIFEGYWISKRYGDVTVYRWCFSTSPKSMLHYYYKFLSRWLLGVCKREHVSKVHSSKENPTFRNFSLQKSQFQRVCLTVWCRGILQHLGPEQCHKSWQILDHFDLLITEYLRRSFAEWYFAIRSTSSKSNYMISIETFWYWNMQQPCKSQPQESFHGCISETSKKKWSRPNCQTQTKLQAFPWCVRLLLVLRANLCARVNHVQGVASQRDIMWLMHLLVAKIPPSSP